MNDHRLDLCFLYEKAVPDFLTEMAATEPMRRLRDVGMNCGCEYTAYPAYQGILRYTRYEHSLGVGLITWHFSRDKAQALAGLLHDVATPTFAHSIDFLKGDYLTQESTEDGTTQIIGQSQEIQRILLKNGLETADVCDYHRYPIADNDSPQLSADRLEYTLGNLVNFGIRKMEEVGVYYQDLTVGTNEFGQEEIMFRTPETALDFSEGMLVCSEIYVADADRFAMQALADLLKGAVSDGVIAEQDFHSTETELLRKLTADPGYRAKWEEYRSYSKISASDRPRAGEPWVKVFAKKRYIDPFVSGQGRVSRVCPEFAGKLAAFREKSQDYWICGR